MRGGGTWTPGASLRRARLVMCSYGSPSAQDYRTDSRPRPRPLAIKTGGRPADHGVVSTSATSGVPGSVQMALLAKVLDAARPVPASSPSQAVTQAASSQALLETVTALDVLA